MITMITIAMIRPELTASSTPRLYKAPGCFATQTASSPPVNGRWSNQP